MTARDRAREAAAVLRHLHQEAPPEVRWAVQDALSLILTVQRHIEEDA